MTRSPVRARGIGSTTQSAKAPRRAATPAARTERTEYVEWLQNMAKSGNADQRRAAIAVLHDKFSINA